MKAFLRTFSRYVAIMRQGVNPDIPHQFAGRRHFKYSKQSPDTGAKARGQVMHSVGCLYTGEFLLSPAPSSDTPHGCISFIDLRR
jgi:hypothetical protein